MPLAAFPLAAGADSVQAPGWESPVPARRGDVMEKVRCPEHGSLCLLKTGTREGPNKGRSFYVCPANRGLACQFSRPTDLPASHCLLHDGCQLDLQALVKQDSGSYRLYYRCVKSDGKKFCGSVPWKEESKCKVTSRSDAPRETGQPRNPFRVINEGPRPPVWKQISEERKRSSEEKSGEEAGVRGRNPSNGGDQTSSHNRRGEQMGVRGRNPSNGGDQTSSHNRTGEQMGVRGLDPSDGGDQTSSHNRRGEQMGVRGLDPSDGGDQASGQERKKSGDEAGGRGKNPSDGGDKISGQERRRIGEEMGVRGRDPSDGGDQASGQDKGPLDQAGGLRRGGRVADNSEEAAIVGRIPGDITWGSEVQRTRPPSNGGQEAAEEPASFSGWRERELPAGLKVKKKLPEDRAAAEEAPGSPGVSSITAAEPGKEPEEEEDDVVFVSSQPPKEKTSGGGKQRTITSFPGFTAPAEGPSPAALHATLSAQLQQKKATLAAVNLKALPDGGGRLLRQVQELEDALGALTIAPEAVGQPDPQTIPRIRPEAAPPSSRAGPAERTGGVKPLSFHQLPPSDLGLHGATPSYSSLYGVAPQLHSLYGGRMTEERLFAVRNATSETIDHLHKSLESCPGPENTAEDPRGLKVPLLLHQKQALAWLQWRERQRPQGGILADDMGLGKTLTMIALILAQKQRQKEEDEKLESWISKTDSTLTVSRGTLIICPASLVHHWKKEVEKRVSDGRLRVCLYHGANREKDCKQLAQYDIVVTTYSLVSKEIPAKKEEGDAPAKDQDLEDRAASSPLLRLAWARIILDEAHNIKNPKVQTSIAVCKLRAGARWAVTGTPIQNNLLDLYSLLRFLRCSPFDEFKLWKSQVDNGSRKGGERLTILTKSLLLRRTKDQLDHTGRPLVELPQRRCQLHQLQLSAQEQAVYDVIFARSRSTLQHYLRRHEGGAHEASRAADNPFDRVAREFGSSQGDALAPPPSSQGSSTVHILSLLLRLRQCCCHLSLLKTTLDQLELKSEGLSLTLEEQLNALSLSDLQSPDPKSSVSLNGSNFQAELFQTDSGSSKVDALISELRTINSGADPQKSVIVSQWTSMLKIVAVHLKRIGLSYATIDGSINPKLRMDVVEEFNNNPRGPQVMLVSLCAGGVGLNLIGGNHLFLMDMHWNPALEDQACDRIYRVGQRKDVVIHRFVCQGTVEEKISQLQEKKKDLAKKVLTGNGSTFTKLTLTDLRLLFGV